MYELEKLRRKVKRLERKFNRACERAQRHTGGALEFGKPPRPLVLDQMIKDYDAERKARKEWEDAYAQLLRKIKRES